MPYDLTHTKDQAKKKGNKVNPESLTTEREQITGVG